MTCTDTDPCLMCQIDNTNQGRPAIPDGPTVLESAIGGMAIGFCICLGFTVMWGLGLFIDYLVHSVRGFGQVAFAAFSIGGLLAGIWQATVGRR